MIDETTEDEYFTYKVLKRVKAPSTGEICIFYKRERKSPQKIRLVKASDLRTVFTLGVYGLARILIKRSQWSALVKLMAKPTWKKLRRKRLNNIENHLSAVHGESCQIDPQVLLKEIIASEHRRKFMLAGEIFAPSKAYQVKLIGKTLLQDALAGGKGAVVWAQQLSFQTIAGKRALFEHGIEATQLSADTHGFSDSRLGQLFLNRPMVKVENRYLKGRIIIKGSGTTAAKRKMIKTLGDKGVLLSTNNIYAGSLFVEVPFGKNGFVDMPSGPVSIALGKHAAIFSMRTIETEEFTKYETVLEPLLLPNDTKSDPIDQMERTADIIIKERDILLQTFTIAPEQFHITPGRPKSKFSR